MKSYAMVFSPVDAAGTDSSVRAWNYELRGGDDTALPAGSTEAWEAGWVGSTGPGIEQDQWPRPVPVLSRISGRAVRLLVCLCSIFLR